MNTYKFSSAKNEETIVTKTTSYTPTIEDDLILADTSGGALSLTLPAVAGCKGKIFKIIKVDSSANALTVDGNASETHELQINADNLLRSCNELQKAVMAVNVFMEAFNNINEKDVSIQVEK